MKSKIIKSKEYTDREIVLILNKILKNIDPVKFKKITILGFKVAGQKIQEALKTQSMSSAQILSFFDEVILNPPKPPPEPAKPTPEELQQAEEDQNKIDNQYESKIVNGHEVLYFSEQGMNNLCREDNEDFEDVGNPKITDHEDDGRIFKHQKVKRLSDGKVFYYNYIWHPEYPTSFFEHNLTEV